MKTFLQFFILVCLISCTMALSIPHTSAAPIEKAVLILFPYQLDLPNHELSLQALREEFDSVDDLELELYYEYLELARFPDPTYQQHMFDLLAEKYRNKKIDLVILQSEVLLSLWLEQRAAILPDTPVVFHSTKNTVFTSAIQLPPDVTGVSGVVDFTPSIKWILSVRPSVNEIVLVYGAGPTASEYTQPVDILQQATGNKIQITDLSGLSLDEIKQQVSALPQSSIVLYEIMFADAAGNKYRPVDVMRELAAASPVPIICGYDHFIGNGTIGGYMYSSEQQARDAARMGLRILRGEAVSDIPAQKDQSNRFIFDHRMLQRFDIPLSDLPPGSIIKNRQYSMWDLYRPQIIAAITTIAVLLFLVILLLVVTRKLNVARLTLAKQTRELTQAYADLQIQDRLRSEFIETISHQLRTPLTSMTLYFDLLSKSAPDKRDKYTDGLKTAINRLSSLIEAILDFSTLQKKLETANWAAVDLNALVTQAVAAIDAQAQARDLELSFSPDPTVPEVFGDSAQLQQVVSHLLQNAISYTLSGYVKVSTQQADEGKSVCLIVTDSGMGMDEEEIAHCFERFYRGKRVGQYNLVPGTGLGLATIKDIVTFHKGRIEVESKLDQGSTFSVFLPVQ